MASQKVRIATFNAENLMQRFAFPDHKSGFAHGDQEGAQQWVIPPSVLSPFELEDRKRTLTAKAIAQTNADIICLQEIENMQALADFDRDYLQSETKVDFDQKILIEGNDGRGIDVALLARNTSAQGAPIHILAATSHAHLTYDDLGLMNGNLELRKERPEERVFRRDCLVVDMTIGGAPLTLVIVHMKSMTTDAENGEGRAFTMPIRKAESRAVRKILETKFGTGAPNRNWLICGDLNDYCRRLDIHQPGDGPDRFELAEEGEFGFSPLIDDGFAENLVARRPKDNQWTLFYTKAIFQHHLVQLDYILSSPAISKRNPDAIPEIIRNGLPHRVLMPLAQQVDRYEGTGWDNPKASDHCPVVVTLDIA